MRAVAFAALLALPGAALAHDPTSEVVYAPGYAWFEGPGTPRGADGRIRVVAQPGHGRAAMTLNQFDAYQQAYRRHLGRLGMRMSYRAAEARAHHAAWHEVVGTSPEIRVEALDLRPLRAGEVPLVFGY